MTSTDPDRDLVLVEFHFHELVLHLWAGEALDLFTWRSSFLFSIWKGQGDCMVLNEHSGIVLLDVLNKGGVQAVDLSNGPIR